MQPAVAHFLKVTRSYWPGLFHCYDVPGLPRETGHKPYPALAGLPRTNNALEQLFGSQRYHERRTTGRKVASPSLVLRGAVRIITTVMTRLRPFSPDDLVPPSLADWCAWRTQLASHRQQRTLQRRFRQNPAAYLALFERRFVQLILPL